jgi:hypothetical protein
VAQRPAAHPPLTSLAPTCYAMAAAFHGAACTVSTLRCKRGCNTPAEPVDTPHLVDGLVDKDQLSGLQQTP